MGKNKWKQASEQKAGSNIDAEAQSNAPQIDKVDFDAWFAVRAGQIPRHHHKEIIKADFKARGLGQCESLEDFDGALNKYGIKLA